MGGTLKLCLGVPFTLPTNPNKFWLATPKIRDFMGGEEPEAMRSGPPIFSAAGLRICRNYAK
jgi:hypothetical protein